MSRELRDIRRALAAEKKNPAPAYNLQRPASAGSLALNAASIRPLTSASGSLTQKIHRPDYSKEIGLWVAKRLSDLQAAEDDTATRLNEGRQARQLDDPQLWDADQVSLWLREVVGLSEPTIAHLHAQDIHGLELFTLDDADLGALGCALAERKRLLQMTGELRRAAPSAKAAAAASANGGHQGGGTLQLHLDSRRQRLTVLGQCLGRVLSFCPSVPLRIRRLITVLWQQTEAIGVESLARIELDQIAYERRAMALAERNRRTTRSQIEPHMTICARLEDTIIELEKALELERTQLQILRDSVEAPEPSRPRRKGEGEAFRLLQPADYPVGSWDLGDHIHKIGGDMENFLGEVEREGVHGERALKAADAMEETLSRGIYEQQKRRAAEARKAAEDARKAAEAKAASAAAAAAVASTPASTAARSRPGSSTRSRGSASRPGSGSGTRSPASPKKK